MKQWIKLWLLLLVSALILVGCLNDGDDDVPHFNEISELEVPENFDWNNIQEVNVDVTVIGLPEARANSRVELLDESGQILTAGILQDNTVMLKARYSDLGGNLQVYLPAFNLVKRLKGGLVDYKVTLQISNVESKDCVNLFGNPGFEDNQEYDDGGDDDDDDGEWEESSDLTGVLYPAPQNYHPPIDGNWYYYQQNNNHNIRLVEQNNNTYVSLAKHSFLYQAVAVNGGGEASFQFDISNYNWNYFSLQIHLTSYAADGSMTGDEYIYYNSYWDGIYGDWQNLSHDFVVPDNTVEIAFTLYVNSNTVRFWVDNFGLCLENQLVDTDNDGVSDEEDDYPDDPTKSVKVKYPTQGQLIVAFEDLWPDMGDYDFNDLVLGVNQEFGLNANNEYTYIKTDLEVRGNGATINNVLAMQLDWLESIGGTNTYTHVGDNNMQLVPSNGDMFIDGNKVVIINGVLDGLSPYYQNNGIGVSASYQNFSFEVTMDPISSTTASLSPDFFIYDYFNPQKEIHLPGRPATANADMNLFGTGDDASIPTSDIWYVTDTNLPWGFEIIDHTGNYMHPLENISILNAYRYFGNWANSGGLSHMDWFLDADNDSVYHTSY